MITADHPAASDGKQILLIDGKPVSTEQAFLADYRVIDATPAEVALLDRGGYHFDVEVA